MSSYLASYGVGEERRNRIIKWLIIGICSILLLTWAAYLFFHDYFETRTVKHFLAEVNAKEYKAAYRDWGCTDATPCPNYQFDRFLEDWGPEKKVSAGWKIDSVDGCRGFVTVNVTAPGTELQSIGVERGSKTLMFAPAPECQEKKIRFKQFFQRMLGRSS